MKIKIYQSSFVDNISIYMNDKKKDCLIVNRRPVKFDLDRFKFLIIDMISNWPQNLINEDIVDGLEYKIVLKDNNSKETVFKFKNKFPDDIFRLKSLINEVLQELK